MGAPDTAAPHGAEQLQPNGELQVVDAVPRDGAADKPTIDSARAAADAQLAFEIVGTLRRAAPERHTPAVDAAGARLISIAPRDGIEEMLASQMLALHAAMIDCAQRAMLPGQPGPVRREELRLAERVSRSFSRLVEVMDRRRRGGEQKVKVEHVHVYPGGQAIVGTIEQGGGGSPSKSAKQSHAR